MDRWCISCGTQTVFVDPETKLCLDCKEFDELFLDDDVEDE